MGGGVEVGGWVGCGGGLWWMVGWGTGWMGGVCVGGGRGSPWGVLVATVPVLIVGGLALMCDVVWQ
jgi:hypothetical protein